MYMNAIEFFFLTFVVICAIYLVHMSKLRILREQAKGEIGNRQFQQVNSKLVSILEAMRELNYSIELTAEEQRSKQLMCFKDGSKTCSVCEGDCPYRQGGEMGR